MKDKDKALYLKKLNDDNPRLTAKIVMKKTKYLLKIYIQICIPMYTWYVDLFGLGFNSHMLIEACTIRQKWQYRFKSFNFSKTGTISINLSASGNESLDYFFYSLTKVIARWMTRQDFPFKRKLYTPFAGKTSYRNVRQLRRSIDAMTFSLNINLKNTFGLVHRAVISPIKFAAIKF